LWRGSGSKHIQAGNSYHFIKQTDPFMFASAMLMNNDDYLALLFAITICHIVKEFNAKSALVNVIVLAFSP
jgi:hypothetical protein